MKQLTVLLATLFATLTGLNAQTITGYVKDSDNKPIAKASVSLLNTKDSSLVKMNASNADGSYKFESIIQGSYLIATTSVGYSPVYSGPFELKNEDVVVPDLILQNAATQMQGVTVTARKPLVEVRSDKMVVNVEGTINATGNDALELLRRSPGVLVDKDDNISMAGKNGVEIYIDGKPSPLRGADLANYLKTMQSSNIEAIELITNPSAKYEAAGNAGIINIRLKKDKSLGTNGSVNAGYNQGFYPKYNGGINLNHRNKKVNIFGNYNHYNGKWYNKQNIYREQSDSIFDQSGIMTGVRRSHNYKAGLDYFLNSRNTIGMMANGSTGINEFNSDGPMTIASKATGIVDRVLKANTDAHGKRNNINTNLNYRYADTSGRELNVDVDYGKYRNNSNQFLPNIYYNADATTELYRNVYRMLSASDIDIYSLKADYEQKLGKGKLGFGGKAGVVETKNDFKRYDVINDQDKYDTARSNKFNYKENINALYVNYNRPFKGFAVQLGLRAENTVSNGTSNGYEYNTDLEKYQPVESSLKRNYIDFFPSASVAFNKNPKSQLSVSYSRRIDRPRYENLNPFEMKLNDYLYVKGNKELKPQYTNSFGITHTYKYKLTSSLNYSHVRDMFVQVMEPIEGNKAYQTTKNLANQDVVSANVSYPFMYKTFTMFNNLTANYSHYKANFGNGRIIDRDVFNWQYYVQNSYKFGKKKDWTAELTGLYLSPFIWEGVFKGKSMGFVDVGMQKTIMQGRGTLKASVSDIFKTMHFNGDGSYAGIYTRVGSNWESQQFKLNFTYRFGSAQVKAARQRKSGLEDEAGRTNGGSGAPGQQR